MSMLILVIVFGLFIFNSPLANPIYKTFAELFFKQKKYSLALKLYEKLFHFNEFLDTKSTFANKTAICHESLGNFTEAIQWYKKTENWTKVGQLYIEIGQIEKAIPIFEQLNNHNRLALCYEVLQDFNAAGNIYLKHLNNKRKAFQYFEKGLPQNLDISTTITFANFIHLCYEEKLEEKGTEYFERLIQFMYNHPDAKYPEDLKPMLKKLKQLRDNLKGID